MMPARDQPQHEHPPLEVSLGRIGNSLAAVLIALVLVSRLPESMHFLAVPSMMISVVAMDIWRRRATGDRWEEYPPGSGKWIEREE